MKPIFHYVNNISGPTIRLDSQNFCIYCGDKSSSKLTREHIIPDGLGGDLILPNASCERCAKETCKIESFVMRSMLSDARGAFGLKSRKKKKGPPIKQIVRDNGNPDKYRTIEYRDENTYVVPAVAVPDGPTVLKFPVPENNVLLKIIYKNPELNNNIYGPTESVVVLSNTTPFLRMIAKIAYSFWMATFDFKWVVNPSLAEYIIGKINCADDYFIGSIDPDPETSDGCLHYVKAYKELVIVQNLSGVYLEEFHFVNVRLFANLPTPVYKVCICPNTRYLYI